MGQNELQKDFTQFVGQIIEQISKEIYIEDLRKIYDSYIKCLDNLKEEAETFTETGNKIHQNQCEVVDTISDIQRDLEQKTRQIEDALSVFYNGYEKILKQYENKIVSLNKKERTNFKEEIQTTIQETHDVKLKNVEDIFLEYTEKLQNMSDSVAKAEDLEKIVSEMALTKDSMQEFVSETYLETVTDFEERIADLNIKERQELSLVVKEMFQEENNKLKHLVENYSNTLQNIASEMMTHEDLESFKQGIAQYTNRIQYLTEQRYAEVLRAFENSLLEMGKVQFEKYLESMNRVALKASDLENFLEQIKVLELSIKAQVKNSEVIYIQIFDRVKSGIETLNENETQKCMKILSAFFSEQILLFNEAFDRHQQMLLKHEQEQQSLSSEIDKVEQSFKKNEENNKKILQALFVLRERESDLDDKITALDKKITALGTKEGELIAKQQYMMKEIEMNRMNVNALSVLNIIQFILIILLFLMSGDIGSVFPKIVLLIALLAGGVSLLVRKKK